MSASADTFPRLLLEQARQRPDKAAMREKDLGIWQTWTWAQVLDEVRRLAAGLAALGFKRGENLAIIGDNRPRLYWSMAAAQMLGGIPVPLYQDAVADEMAFVLDDAEIRYAVVEDQEQVDKLLEVMPRCPHLKHLIYDEPRGLRAYDAQCLIEYGALQDRGQTFIAEHTGYLDEQIALGRADDVAIMLYTSGTTGRPKGVMLTHDNMIITGRNAAQREGLRADEEVIAYLPMAWVGDNMLTYTQSMVTGFCVNCPESGETVINDMREIGPTYYFAPPRVWENLLTQVMIRMEDASRIKRSMFNYFMAVARRCGIRILDGKPVALGDRLLYALGDVLVYGPLRNVLGLSRIRLAYTAGEAIGPEIFDFYRSFGVNMKQLYGSTEASVFVCIQPDGQVYADTVGTPCTGVEVKISESGEVMFRGPGVFRAYHRNPEATAEARTDDGWVRTGDAGYYADNGHLKIIDRAKDVGTLTDGTLFAPKYLENKLKFSPFVKEAVAFGDQRGFATVLVNIDLSAVGNWAERRNLAYSGYTDLAAQSVVYDLVQDCVEQVNKDLANDAKLGGSQIRRFLILHKELDADDGELTRTRKVRRSFIADKYSSLIDALYNGATQAHVETQVKFEDGRVSMLSADLVIRDVAAQAATRRAA